MDKKEKLEDLERQYESHKREHAAIVRQDGASHAWFVKGVILRRLFEKIKSLKNS